jgi:hypothetical protein
MCRFHLATMAKSKATKRKQKGQQAGLPAPKKPKSTATITPPPDVDESVNPKSIATVVLEEDLDIAIDTIQTLAKYPNLIKSKACKELRVAVWDFRQACTTGVNTAADANLTSRISAALADGKYTDARILLAEMRIRKESPKLGALCRWVRDLDVVSGLSMQEHGISQTSVLSSKDRELLLVLDAILRVTGPVTTSAEEKSISSSNPINLQREWNLRSSSPRQQVYATVLKRRITTYPHDSLLRGRFCIVETTPGPVRKPPNAHPAILHTCEPDTIALCTPPDETTKHTHPLVPNLSLLKDFLSPMECMEIIDAAETIGFTPDAPTRDDRQDASILAHNFYWVVDTGFHDKLWSRVASFVPASVGGKKVRGLNRRFRVYRYVPGAEYRMHIDGAWPPSSILHPESPTPKYIYDSSPADKKQSSLFTFLIYLNDEFSAGETTFFLPSEREGVMNAYPVKPVMGSVAMFPHGEAQGSLLHEGTGVRDGAKYVIRTDVIYDVDAGVDGES